MWENKMLLNYVIAFASLGVILLALSFFILVRHAKKTVNIIFAFYSLSIAWWSIFTIPMIVGNSQKTAHLYDQLCLFGSIFIPSTFLHFVLVYLRKSDKYKRLIIGSYLCSVMFGLANANGVLFSGVKPAYVFHYYTVPNYIYTMFVLYFSISSTIGISFLYKEMRNPQISNSLRTQLKLLFLFSLLGYTGGGANFLLVYGIEVPVFTSIANYAILIYGLAVAYLILKYRFLDIEVIIKKTLIFTGLFAMVNLIATTVASLTQSYIGEKLALSPKVSLMITGITILIFYTPTRNFLIRITDRFLFQKKEDIRVILNRLAEEIISVLDKREIGDRLMRTIETAFRAENATLLIKTNESEGYRYEHVFGFESVLAPPSGDSAFLHYFSSFDKILHLEDETVIKQTPPEVRAQAAAIKAALAVPLFHQGQLIGILTLGKKKSDQDYTKDEIEAFPALAAQVAVAISNSQLLDQIVKEQTDKKRIQVIAERVNYTRSLKHEGGNKMVGVLNAAFTMESSFKIAHTRFYERVHEKLTEPELNIHEKLLQIVTKSCATIARNAERVILMIDTMVDGLRGDEMSYTIFDFRLTWETAKRNLEMDRNYRFLVEIDEPFKLYGNVCLIERVFENLLSNSRDALKEGKDGLITLKGSYRDIDGEKATWFEYSDTGPGVQEALFDKVFLQDFSTKPKPQSSTSLESGHGQGLYICRKTVEEFHSGKIWLEKSETGGSKFIFWIPFKNDSQAEGVGR